MTTTESPGAAAGQRVLRLLCSSTLPECRLLGHEAIEWWTTDKGTIWLIRHGQDRNGIEWITFRWICRVCDGAAFATFHDASRAVLALVTHHREGYCRGHKEGALLP